MDALLRELPHAPRGFGEDELRRMLPSPPSSRLPIPPPRTYRPLPKPLPEYSDDAVLRKFEHLLAEPRTQLQRTRVTTSLGVAVTQADLAKHAAAVDRHPHKLSAYVKAVETLEAEALLRYTDTAARPELKGLQRAYWAVCESLHFWLQQYPTKPTQASALAHILAAAAKCWGVTPIFRRAPLTGTVLLPSRFELATAWYAKHVLGVTPSDSHERREQACFSRAAHEPYVRLQYDGVCSILERPRQARSDSEIDESFTADCNIHWRPVRSYLGDGGDGSGGGGGGGGGLPVFPDVPKTAPSLARREVATRTAVAATPFARGGNRRR